MHGRDEEQIILVGKPKGNLPRNKGYYEDGWYSNGLWKVWTGFIGLNIGSSIGRLLVQLLNNNNKKKRLISWPTEELSTSAQGPSTIQLISFLKIALEGCQGQIDIARLTLLGERRISIAFGHTLCFAVYSQRWTHRFKDSNKAVPQLSFYSSFFQVPLSILHFIIHSQLAPLFHRPRTQAMTTQSLQIYYLTEGNAIIPNTLTGS